MGLWSQFVVIDASNKLSDKNKTCIIASLVGRRWRQTE